MKCPKELKAGPYLYRVRNDPSNENYAESNYVHKTITFGDGVVASDGIQALASLIHEWMHIAEENSTVPTGNRMNHDVMRLLSTWIVDLLQQLGLDTNLDISELVEP